MSTTPKKRKDASPTPGSPKSPVHKKTKASDDMAVEDEKTDHKQNGDTSSSSAAKVYAYGEMCHIDIPVKNMTRACKFYADVFDWEIRPWQDEYAIWKSKGKDAVAGGFYLHAGPIANDGCVYGNMWTENVEDTLQKVHDHGGVVLRSKFLIAPGVGCNAICLDTEGNRIALYTKNDQDVQKTDKLEQTLHFATVSPAEAFERFMDEKKHADMCGAPCTVSREVLGLFHVAGDYIVGRNIEIVPNKKIVQSWRAKDMPPGWFSKITVTFEAEGDSGSKVHLLHEEIPTAQVDHFSKGWYQYYWNMWGEGVKNT